MKAERKTAEPKFEPVQLILESQHEVDAVYAMLSHFEITDALDLRPDSFEAVKPYSSTAGGGFLFCKLAHALRK